jgi:uncharacterized membrane protein (UPF0127 family)
VRAATLRLDDGAIVCERCVVADTMWTRVRGLLGRRDLPRGEGLLIRPTWSIHMFFMVFPIDAVFLGGDGTVLRIVTGLRPWRWAACLGAREVVELASGEAARRGVVVGRRLVLV